MSQVTLYPSGPPTGLDLGAAGSVVTNYGPGTVSYSDTAEPFTAEGTIAASASATLTGTQFFRAAAGAVIATRALSSSAGDGNVSSDDVSTIAVLTAAEYAALDPPVATTLYVVVG
jgi:hypothetical protein